MATTIKETLQALNQEDRDKLMIAFNHGLSSHIVLEDNRFIGVNVKPITGLIVETSTENGWAIGRLE